MHRGEMPDTNRRVQNIIDEFVRQLTQVAREEAARVVMGGIGSTGSTSRSASRDGRGAKRSAEDLAHLEEQVVAFVTKHPGLRIEQINEQLGTDTKSLALPIRKLIATKKLKTQGTRRATKYFAGGSGAAATKPTSKPKARGSKRARAKK